MRCPSSPLSNLSPRSRTSSLHSSTRSGFSLPSGFSPSEVIARTSDIRRARFRYAVVSVVLVAIDLGAAEDADHVSEVGLAVSVVAVAVEPVVLVVDLAADLVVSVVAGVSTLR